MKAVVFSLLFMLQVQGVAPLFSGFSIQGTSINLSYYKGKQNVLVVFYRTQG
jgi:peroxiredoxin